MNIKRATCSAFTLCVTEHSDYTMWTKAAKVQEAMQKEKSVTDLSLIIIIILCRYIIFLLTYYRGLVILINYSTFNFVTDYNFFFVLP